MPRPATMTTINHFGYYASILPKIQLAISQIICCVLYLKTCFYFVKSPLYCMLRFTAYIQQMIIIFRNSNDWKIGLCTIILRQRRSSMTLQSRSHKMVMDESVTLWFQWTLVCVFFMCVCTIFEIGSILDPIYITKRELLLRLKFSLCSIFFIQ